MKKKIFRYDDFIKGHYLIGEGRFGRVYQGLCSLTGELVAIKEYCKISEEKITLIKKNFERLYELNHPNIISAIPLYDTLGQGKTKYFSIIYELCKNSSIEELIKNLEVLMNKLLDFTPINCWKA